MTTPPPIPPPLSPAGGAAVASRFCAGCGAAWNPLWVQCPGCAAKARSRRAAAQGARDGGSIISSLALYFTLLAASAVMIAVSQYAHAGFGAMITVQIIDSLLVIGWCLYERKEVGPALLKSPGPPMYGVAVIGAVGTFLVAALSVQGLHWIFKLPHGAYGDPFLQRGYSFAAVILSVCVQPAIIEELAFRGVILAGMQRILNDREAVFVSAGMFMVLHLSVLSFPHLLLIGVVLGFLRIRTGSLYPGMLLHFCHNFLCVGQEHWFR